MTEYVLGPSIASVVEPEAAPAPMHGRVGIEFHTTPTEPGGKVNVVLATPASPTDKRPDHIHAVYVSPPENVPADRTAEWFMQSSYPKGSVPVPQPPAGASGVLTIQVPGVRPGLHFVQTVLEYTT
jgi:hypothetical protein